MIVPARRVLLRAQFLLLMFSAAAVLAALMVGTLRQNALLVYVEQYGEAAQARMVDVDRRLDTNLHNFVDCQASWLPDTNTVILTSTPPGRRHQVIALDVFKGASRSLTDTPNHNEAPAVSPEGTRVAYAANRTLVNMIYQLDLRTGERQPIGAVPMWVTQLRWSPDGTRIVAQGVQRNRYATVYVLNVERGGMYRLPNLRWANWTQGHLLTVYEARREGSDDLYLFDLVNGREQRLTETDMLERLPVWSPDGKRIAYVSGDARGRQLMLHELESGRTMPLTERLYADISLIVWSNDGSQIAFSGRSNTISNQYSLLTPYDIYAVNSGGGTVRTLRYGFGNYVNNFSRFCAMAWQP